MKKKIPFLAAAFLMCSFPVLAQDGLVTRPSKHSVAETSEKFDAAVRASGVYQVFFRLDHSANAEREAGAKLPPSQLFLFGNPKGGAPLLKESPRLGLDLPNRLLIWQDADGKTWVTYNDVRALLTRHGIKRTDEQFKTIEDRQAALIAKAIE